MLWRFGNTRQARLAGTRKEARHAPIPGQPGTGTAPRRSRASDPTSIFNSAGLGSGLSTFDPSLGYSSLSPLASSSRGGFPLPLSSSGGLSTLQSLSSMSPIGPEPTATSFRSSGGQGSLFPPLDPLPLSMGGTGGLIPGLDQLGAYSGQPSSQRSRRRSIVS